MDRCTEFTFGVPWIMGFFHQDWTLDAATEVEVVKQQFVAELEPTAVLLVRRDARLLLNNLASDQITTLWESCAEGGEYFFHRGRIMDAAEWMRQVIEVCDGWLSCRTDAPELSDADRYEGQELAGAVLALTGEFGDVIGARTADALAECVRRCTPDLGFRLLLRALANKYYTPSDGYVTLTGEQYARLEETGAAFHYGEYVVTDVEHLVVTGSVGDNGYVIGVNPV